MQRSVINERYTIIELLGGGGIADVYLAHDEGLDRDVALKVLKDRYASDEEFVERFRSEAQSAARLSHPNIVSIYDQGRSEDGAYYVAMEYVPWGTLKDRIRRDGALEPDVAAGVALQIADALSAAHKQGVIHRGVKSQNILVTRRGDIKGTNDVKVTDFGIARATYSSPTAVTGAVLSAAGYMSPEQAKGEPVGPASDLYSLGVVIYEMLTGSLPYTAEDLEALKTMHASEPPRSPREANPKVPKSLDAITQKLLAKNPENRYASAEDLSEALERAYSELSPVASKRRRGGMLLLVAGALLLFLALLVLLAGRFAWALIPENPRGQPKAAAQKGWQPDAETKGLRKELDDELSGKQSVPGVGRRGSENDDVLQGTDDHDALSGGDGDDELSGDDGDDKIDGGNGNDTLSGGPGADTFLGGNGVDEIDTGDDDVEDIVRCGDGFDMVTVGAEDTVLGCEDITTR